MASQHWFHASSLQGITSPWKPTRSWCNHQQSPRKTMPICISRFLHLWQNPANRLFQGHLCHPVTPGPWTDLTSLPRVLRHGRFKTLEKYSKPRNISLNVSFHLHWCRLTNEGVLQTLDIQREFYECIFDFATSTVPADGLAPLGVRPYAGRMMTNSVSPGAMINGAPWWRHQMETFPRYWPLARGIHRSPVDFPHKDMWRRPLIFASICAWTNGWANNRDAGDSGRRCAHYGVTVMVLDILPICS